MKKIKDIHDSMFYISDDLLTNDDLFKILLNNDIKNLELLKDTIDCIMTRIHILEIIVVTFIIFNIILLIFK